MKEIKNSVKVVALLMISTFIMFGCSKDDEGTNDLEVNFVIGISPEGAGTVNTSVSNWQYGDAVKLIQLTAIPSEGFTFLEWETGTHCFGTNNPCTFSSPSWKESITVRTTAVFEAIE